MQTIRGRGKVRVVPMEVCKEYFFLGQSQIPPDGFHRHDFALRELGGLGPRSQSLVFEKHLTWIALTLCERHNTLTLKGEVKEAKTSTSVRLIRT